MAHRSFQDEKRNHTWQFNAEDVKRDIPFQKLALHALAPYLEALASGDTIEIIGGDDVGIEKPTVQNGFRVLVERRQNEEQKPIAVSPRIQNELRRSLEKARTAFIQKREACRIAGYPANSESLLDDGVLFISLIIRVCMKELENHCLRWIKRRPVIKSSV